MATFRVTLQRIAFATVMVEAKSAAEVRKMLADDELSYEMFHTATNAWYGPEIKIKFIDRAEVTE
jgi:hypothetical protein